MIAKSIKPDHSIVVLAKLTDTLSYPVSVAAIKTETQVIEIMDSASLQPLIPRIIPGLLKVPIQSVLHPTPYTHHTMSISGTV